MVKQAKSYDLDLIASLAAQLWDSHTPSDLKEEFSELIQSKNACFFLKYEASVPVGFAQCQLRHDYVEGTSTCPVGYLEGIFVKKEYRHQGYAKELLAECEKWAKEKGCTEFASDCELENDASFHFHKAMNFTEANRIICFTKKIMPQIRHL